MTEPRSKAALLELIERERGLWDDLVAEIGEDRMLQPGATGDWNFRDVVAHLNGWRIGTLARLAAARDHSDPKEKERCRPSILRLNCLKSTPGPFSDYLRMPRKSFRQEE